MSYNVYLYHPDVKAAASAGAVKLTKLICPPFPKTSRKNDSWNAY